MLKIILSVSFCLTACAFSHEREPQGRKTLTIRSSLGREIPMTVLSAAEAIEIQKSMATNSDLTWKHPENGCNFRAYRVNQLLEKQGILSAKIFTQSLTKDRKGNLIPLKIVNPYVKSAVSVFHTAALLMVEDELQVVDPTLFPNRLASVEEWKKCLVRHQSKIRTEEIVASRFQLSVGDEVLSSYNYDTIVDEALTKQKKKSGNRNPIFPSCE